MKTVSYIYKYVSALLLAVAALLPATAQTTAQDALYIYRNDGGFNGFFYNDIERIEFSRTGLNGIEYDDYVVQEVYALDSVYRIPIAAIDSVAFITPETQYKKGVVSASSDLWQYVTASDTITWFTLQSATPASLTPKVGDKLALTEARPHLPHGFFGRVKSVSADASGIRVVCEEAELTELFDQYVAKVAAEAATEEVLSSRPRRASGENSTVLDVPLPRFYKKWDLNGINYGLSDHFSISGEGSVELSFTPQVNIRAFLSVGWLTGVNFDIACRTQMDTKYDLDIKAGLSASVGLGITAVKVPLGTTPIMFEIEPGLALGVSGEVELEQHLYDSSSGYLMVQYNSDAEGQSQTAFNLQNLEHSWEQKLTGKLSGNAGMYCELNFTLGKKDVARIGARFESGIREELSIGVTLGDLAAPIKYPLTTLYDFLNFDGGFKTAPYGAGKLVASVGKWSTGVSLYGKDKEDTFLSTAAQAGMVPKFSDVTARYDKEQKTVTTASNLSRNTIYFNKLGFALFDISGKEVARQWHDYEYAHEDKMKNYSLTFTGLADGAYKAMPILTVFGNEMLGSPGVDVFVGEASLKMSADTVRIGNDGGTVELDAVTNVSGTVKTECGPGLDEWYTLRNNGNHFTIQVKPNEGLKRRESFVVFSIKDPDNAAITLQQRVPIIQEDPNRLTGLVQRAVYGQMYHDPTNSEYVDVAVRYGDNKVYEAAASIYVWINGTLEDDLREAFDKAVSLQMDDEGQIIYDHDGLTLTGGFDMSQPGTQPTTAQGTFKMSTSYFAEIKNLTETAELFRTPNTILQRANVMLNGTMAHEIEGTFTAIWNAASGCYDFTFTGEGTYQLDCICFDELSGMEVEVDENGDYLNCWVLEGVHPNATVTHTCPVSVSGTTMLTFQATYEYVAE